jgi:hypothetical protein
MHVTIVKNRFKLKLFTKRYLNLMKKYQIKSLTGLMAVMCKKLLFLCEGSSLEWPKTKKAWTKCWLASGWIFDGDRTTGPSGAQSQAKRSTGGSRQDRTGQ